MLLSRAGHDLFKVGHALYKVVHYCCRGHRNSGGWKQRAGGQRFSRQRPEAGACRHCWNRGGADLGALVFYSCIVLMLCPLILHLCTVNWCSSCRGFDCPPVCGAGSCRGAGDPRWGGGVCGSQGKGPPHAQCTPCTTLFDQSLSRTSQSKSSYYRHTLHCPLLVSYQS